MKIQTLLVTGGCGFIGSNFIQMLRRERQSWRILNVDVLSYSGNPENLAALENDDAYELVKGDVADAELMRSLIERADAVVHFAAESHVDRSIIDSGPFIHSNVLGTQVLLDALRAVNADGRGRRLVHVSTDEVYGSLSLDHPEVRFTEETPLAPNSPYSASKAASDCLVRAAHHTFGMDVVITRCSNNFGPYQFPEKVIPLFVTNLIEGRKVPLYGDGRNVRDWIHVNDHASGVLAALEKGKAGEVYNFGGDNERSNLELTNMILGVMGFGPEMIERVKDRPGHDLRYAIDSSKARRDLGWAPRESAWPAGLEGTVRWYRDHESWWKGVKSGAYRDYYAKQYGSR